MIVRTFQTIRPGQPSLMVFVNEGGIGDELMKIPFFHALRARYPDHHITWLSNSDTTFAGSLEPIAPLFFDVVIGSVHFQKNLRDYLFNPFRHVPDLQRRFDLIIDTQSNVLCTLILRKIKHRTFISGSAKFHLSSARPSKGYQRPIHMTQRCCALMKILTGQPMPPIYKVLPLPRHDALASTLLPEGPCYVGLAPGAGHPTRPKKWPLDRYIHIAQQQVKEGRVPVFFLGPNEKDWYDLIQPEVPSALFPERHVSDRSMLGPLMVMALGKRLHVAVANDCGTGHMLAAANVPLVSLFGPTPAEKFAPCVAHLKVLRSQDWGSDAMEAIPVDAVQDALSQLLMHSPSIEASPA